MINNQKQIKEQIQTTTVIMRPTLESNQLNFQVAMEIEKNLVVIPKAASLIQSNIHDLQV